MNARQKSKIIKKGHQISAALASIAISAKSTVLAFNDARQSMKEIELFAQAVNRYYRDNGKRK